MAAGVLKGLVLHSAQQSPGLTDLPGPGQGSVTYNKDRGVLQYNIYGRQKQTDKSWAAGLSVTVEALHHSLACRRRP